MGCLLSFGKAFMGMIAILAIGIYFGKNSQHYGGNFLFTLSIIGFFGFLYLLVYGALIGPRNYDKKRVNRMKNNLEATGFNITHRMGSLPEVAFDNPNRKLAFIFTDGHRVFDYNEVRSWNHEWTNSSQSGRRIQNVIVFKMNNIELPVISVNLFGNAALAEQWYQRLDVMLNEQPVAAPKPKSCPKCDLPVAEDEIFCGNCGNKLK